MQDEVGLPSASKPYKEQQEDIYVVINLSRSYIHNVATIGWFHVLKLFDGSLSTQM